MTDRPIIFSGPMVRALLAGRKTQTRRLATSPLRKCQAGDRLYVRESWQLHSRASDLCTVVYASSQGRSWTEMHHQFPDALAADMTPRPFQLGWRPSIHMPRWASRLTLVVADVLIEPLQSISAVDCVAEGHPRCTGRFADSLAEEVHLDAARDWYMDLWDSLHDADGQRWRDNPQVVSLEFEVLHGNIDRIAA